MLAQKCQELFFLWICLMQSVWIWWAHVFGSTSSPCWDPLRGWTESAQVQFKMPNQSRRCEFVWVSRWGSDKSSTQGQVHKWQELLKCLCSRVFQTGLGCISRIVATSAGASVQFELNGDCTFIFQSNNQMTSPFSRAYAEWGRPCTVPDAGGDASQAHLLQQCTAYPVMKAVLFAKLWSVSIQLKIMHRDG